MADKNTQDPQFEAADLPFEIIAQYVRDLSFENPQAANVLRGGKELPEMDISIGMDARKIPDDKIDTLFEVVLNVRAEAKRDDVSVFIAELQYGVMVIVGDEIPEESYHPFLLIEIPRLAFPFARQILAETTSKGGYPPLLLNPVDFHGLYMQRFGDEIEAAQKEIEEEIKKEVDEKLKN